MRTKSRHVVLDSSMSDEQKQELVTSAAAELQEFRDVHHDPHGNMADDAAESALDEPMRKAPRSR